jgi:hypothetical protein
MKTRSGIRKAIVGVVIAGAITITSLPGGIAHADGSVDAADYVVWRKSLSASAVPAPSNDRPTEEVAFYYNKIAFDY